MLVLSRRIGERLIIAGNISIVISRIAGNRVTIGIEAPDEVTIRRGELVPKPQTNPEEDTRDQQGGKAA